MVDVATQFFSPGLTPLDTSPIMEGAQATAAAYAGVGKALGEGLQQRAENERRQQLEDSKLKLGDIISNPSSYEEETFEPWREDPQLSDLDPMIAREFVARRLEGRGMDHDSAMAQAALIVSPQIIRSVKDTVRSKIQKAASEAIAFGAHPQEVETVLELAGGDAEPTKVEAMNKARARYTALWQPIESKSSLLSQETKAAAERQASAQAHDTEMTKLQAMLSGQEKISDRSFTMMMQSLRTQTEDAQSGKQFERAKELAGFESELRGKLQKDAAALDLDTHSKLLELEASLGAKKFGGGGADDLTPTEGAKVNLFAEGAETAAVYGEARPVPLSSVSGWLTPASLLATMKAAGIEVKPGSDNATIAGLMKTGRDDSAREILDDVTVRLVEGERGALDVEVGGKIPRDAAQRLHDWLVRQPMTTMLAIGSSQALGPMYQQSSDVEQLYSAMQKPGGQRTLRLALRLLASANAKKATAEPVGVPQSSGAIPLSTPIK